MTGYELIPAVIRKRIRHMQCRRNNALLGGTSSRQCRASDSLLFWQIPETQLNHLGWLALRGWPVGRLPPLVYFHEGPRWTTTL
jgi:hypothetical protein